MNILISILPYHFYKILKENKRIEIRSKLPIYDSNTNILFYITKNRQSLNKINFKNKDEYNEFNKLVGTVAGIAKLVKVEDVTDAVYDAYYNDYSSFNKANLSNATLNIDEMYEIISSNYKRAYAWNFESLEVFNDSNDLKNNLLRYPPHSFSYVNFEK